MSARFPAAALSMAKVMEVSDDAGGEAAIDGGVAGVSPAEGGAGRPPKPACGRRGLEAGGRRPPSSSKSPKPKSPKPKSPLSDWLLQTALRNSLIELMKKKSILRITAKEIYDAADIGRTTFYAHYRDPYDLLDQIESETIAHF
jgi:hypothetical protein